ASMRGPPTSARCSAAASIGSAAERRDGHGDLVLRGGHGATGRLAFPLYLKETAMHHREIEQHLRDAAEVAAERAGDRAHEYADGAGSAMRGLFRHGQRIRDRFSDRGSDYRRQLTRVAGDLADGRTTAIAAHAARCSGIRWPRSRSSPAPSARSCCCVAHSAATTNEPLNHAQAAPAPVMAGVVAACRRVAAKLRLALPAVVAWLAPISLSITRSHSGLAVPR